jgi:hypothetical protein
MAFIKVAAAVVGGMLLTQPAWSQASTLGPSTGTVSIRQVQVAFIGSGAIGGGTLTYRGRKYPITVGGLGIGGIGASRLDARGTVYGLKRLEDFSGAYVQLRQGWAVGDQGGGRLWLSNGKGVTLRLATRRRGLQLTMGADGVVIEFKR